jgi:hypothetical protein
MVSFLKYLPASFEPTGVVIYGEGKIDFKNLLLGTPYESLTEQLRLTLFGVYPSSENLSVEIYGATNMLKPICSIITNYVELDILASPLVTIDMSIFSELPEVLKNIVISIHNLQQSEYYKEIRDLYKFPELLKCPQLAQCFEIQYQWNKIWCTYIYALNIINCDSVLDILRHVFPEITKCLINMMSTNYIDMHRIVIDTLSYIDKTSVTTNHYDPVIKTLREMYLEKRFCFPEVTNFMKMILSRLINSIDELDVLPNILQYLTNI